MTFVTGEIFFYKKIRGIRTVILRQAHDPPWILMTPEDNMEVVIFQKKSTTKRIRRGIPSFRRQILNRTFLYETYSQKKKYKMSFVFQYNAKYL